MTIRYQNTFRDVLAFCFYHYPRSPMVIGTYGVALALFSLVAFQSLPAEFSLLRKIVGFAVLEAVILGFLAALFLITTVLGMISRKNKTFLTESTVILTDEGFTSETQYSKSEMKWQIVQKLARTKKHMFIYVAQHAAHVVPRRAFQNENDWESFYDFCRQRTKKL